MEASFHKILEHKHNSLLEFSQQIDDYHFEYIFNSKYYPSKKFCIDFVELDLDSLASKIDLLIDVSYKIAENLSEEPLGGEYQPGSIKNCILRQLNTVSAYSYDCDYFYNSYFYFLSLVLFHLINSHYLQNGNKRITITIVISLLSTSSYYLQFTENYKNPQWKIYEKQLIQFITKEQSSFEKESIIKSIYRWLEKYCILSYKHI